MYRSSTAAPTIADEVEREEDVEQDVARPARAALARGVDPRDAIATTPSATRTPSAVRRALRPRANLHRRVRRPSVEERLHSPAVMGIVNVTPDSFSDGGVHLDPDAAAAAARRMLDEGAAIVDVGGESTRPGSEGVSLDEELRRVDPGARAARGRCRVSIDTAKAEVARRALALGAELVNDVTALRGDPELAGVVADGRRLSLPDAHAGRAADDAGRPALRRRRVGGGRVPRGAARVRRLGRASRRSASASTRASASARRRRRTSSSCGASTSCSRSAGRCSSGSRARARSASSSTRRRAPARSRPRSAPPSPPTSAARRSSASTTSASTSRR